MTASRATFARLLGVASYDRPTRAAATAAGCGLATFVMFGGVMGWLGVGGLLAAAVTLLTPREYAFDRARDIRAWEPDRAKALWFLRILPMLSLCGVIAVASTGADASASYEHLTGQLFATGGLAIMLTGYGLGVRFVRSDTRWKPDEVHLIPFLSLSLVGFFLLVLPGAGTALGG